jgi:peptide/nickel transport system permease protein
LEIGLDRTIPEQYAVYFGRVLHGDFGHSVMTSNPVASDILHFFPATLELATLATVIGVLVGVPAGVSAGALRGRWPDHLVRFIGLFGYSMPVFWLGLVGLWLFYAKLDWVAGPGRIDVGFEDLVEPRTGVLLVDAALARQWAAFNNGLAHIALPATRLGYISLAYIARKTRSFMIDALSQEYLVTARIEGCTFWGAVWTHAFPNILVSLITVVGLSYASLLEGAVLTETVFAWPGLGLYITRSLFNADMNAVLSGTLAVGAVFIGVNATCDLLYRTVDPRLRTA